MSRMERPHWRDIKDTGRKIFSPLKYRAARYGLCAIAEVGVALYSLPPITEGQILPLEVDVKCKGSTPVIEIQGDVPVGPDQIYWLVAEETGSRRFRVLERGDSPRWMFFQKYDGFADPGNKHTELPIGDYNFHPGKEAIFSIYIGDLSSRGILHLGKTKYQVKKFIPYCSKAIT